jgi:Protein of unknown function (DUF3667)
MVEFSTIIIFARNMDTQILTKPICPNCDHEMTETGKFCPNCGQKKFDGRIRVKELLSNMMINIFHLDSKFIKMVGHLLVPAKVSTDFFNGKIIRYPNPVQYFFIIMFFFLVTMNHQCQATLNETVKLGVSTSDSTEVTYSGASFFKAAEKHAELLKLRQAYDQLPDSLKSKDARIAIDSLIAIRKRPIKGLFDKDSISFSLFKTKREVSVIDLAQITPDQFVEKYKFDAWYDKILAKQALKIIRDVSSLANAILGSLTWTILAFNVIMAFLLWLLLRKRRAYYMEHFIFLLHYMSAVLLVITVFFAIDFWVVDIPEIGLIIVNLAAISFLFIAMKRYYQLTNLETVWRWFLFGFVALFVWVLLLAAAFLIVILIL